MWPRTARDVFRWTLGGAALIAATLIGVVLAEHFRQARACRAGGCPSLAAATGPALPTANNGELSTEAWEKLGSAFCGGGFGLFATKAAKRVQVDGLLDPAEWSDSFETRPLDPSCLEQANRPAVRCQWNPDSLLISIHAERSDKMPTSRPSTSCCQVVLAGSDPAVRYRFCVDLNGNRTAHRLTFEQASEIPADCWSAAVQDRAGGISAEFAISPRALRCNGLTGGESWMLIVRSDDGQADEPDSPPAYQLLDSLRGARATVVLLDDDSHRDHSPLGFANGYLGQGCAYQWQWDRFIARPGEPRELLLTSNCNAIVSLAGVTLPLQKIETASAARLHNYRASLPPLAPGLYELAINSSPLLPLWISSDPVKAVRRYLLNRRTDIEKNVADPWPRSILLAHLGRALQSAETPSQVAWPLVESLAELQRALHAAGRGDSPCIPAGVSKLLFTGNEKPSEFTIEVPPHYDPRLAWPVYWGQVGLPNMIGIQPVELAGQMADWPKLQQALRIDENRRYLCEWCAGAYVATDWLVARPELWAGAAMWLRTRWSPLIGNACDVPVLLWSYQPRSVPCLDALTTETAAEWMRKQGCEVSLTLLPNYEHKPVPPERLPDAARWLLESRRTERPATVQCVAKGTASRACYWVGIDCVREPQALSQLTARMDGDVVSVRANENVLGYTLRLDGAPLAPGVRMLKIVENEKLIGQVNVQAPGAVFRRGTACSQPAGDSRIIAQLTRPHPDWQWAQMAAEIVRARTGADVFFSPRMLRASPSAAGGSIRVRDLYAWYHNDWIALARVDRATRYELIPKLYSALPNAVVTGLFESGQPSGSRPAPNETTLVATPANCDEVNRDTAKANPYASAEGAARVADHALSCELMPVYVVDCLVAFFDEHPSPDLDALLDRQQPLSKGRAEAGRMLERELGESQKVSGH